ncbi:MAG TPA: hypothetical protein VK400_09220 [Pyrinomonadaceae bacterium]|nr:hypothetical protein [Pyrinomonadaceae bacterium]
MFGKIILTIFVFLFFACGNPEKPTCNNDENFNEYAVYSAIIQTVYSKSAQQQIVILDKTNIGEMNLSELDFREESLKELRKDFPDFDKSVADNFNSKIGLRSPLERKFSVSMPYVFASEKDFEEIYMAHYPKYYDKFQEKFPEAVSPGSSRMILLSKPGFNENLNQAVAFIQIWADRKSYFLLKREYCEWKVRKELNVSVH